MNVNKQLTLSLDTRPCPGPSMQKNPGFWGLVTIAAFCGFCRKMEKEMIGPKTSRAGVRGRHSLDSKMCMNYKRVLGLGKRFSNLR